MTDSAVIKEFLVGLGFKVDPASYRKFVSGVKDATAAVKGLALASAAAATATVVAVDKIATSLEDLYWTSIRTKSSAANIKATGYAFSQMGSDAKSGLAALEGVASFMRSNPAAEAFLNGALGVKTRNANGGLRDTAATLRDIGAKLSAMPFYRARQYADMLGLGDDKALQALMRGGGGFDDKYLALARRMGVDMDKAAKDANKFKTQTRELLAVLEIGAVKAGTELATWLMPQLEKFTGWSSDLAAHWDGSDVKLIVGDLENLARSANDFLNSFARDGNIDWAWRMREGFEIVGVGIRGTAEGLAQIVQFLTAIKRGDFDEASRLFMGGKPRDGQGRVVAGVIPDVSGEATGAGSRENAAMRFFTGQGWSAAQAAGIVANLKRESGLRTGAVGDGGKAFGIAQWHPDRQANFKRWAGKDIRQSSFAEQMGFVQYELTQGAERAAGSALRGAKGARAAGAIVSDRYERPAFNFLQPESATRAGMADKLLKNYRLGGEGGAGGAALNQNTTVNINGVTDPERAGRAVTSAQRQVNADAVRNLQGALQ